jgi:hypothetical protein
VLDVKTFMNKPIRTFILSFHLTWLTIKISSEALKEELLRG